MLVTFDPSESSGRLKRCGTVKNKVLLSSQTFQGALERLFTLNLQPAVLNHQ